MIYDLDKYRHVVKPQVVVWRETRPDEPQQEAIRLLALSTGCPIMVVAHYIGEIEGYSQSLLDYIKTLDNFYKPEQILGLSETK